MAKVPTPAKCVRGNPERGVVESWHQTAASGLLILFSVLLLAARRCPDHEQVVWFLGVLGMRPPCFGMSMRFRFGRYWGAGFAGGANYRGARWLRCVVCVHGREGAQEKNKRDRLMPRFWRWLSRFLTEVGH